VRIGSFQSHYCLRFPLDRNVAAAGVVAALVASETAKAYEERWSEAIPALNQRGLRFAGDGSIE